MALVIHTASLRVRYAETDKMKIVYNGNYLVYFEIARTELLRACGIPYRSIEERGFMLPVLEALVRYKSPAYYDDYLSIQTSYNIEYQPIIRLDYTITRSDNDTTTLIATGYTTHSFVQAETMKPVRPPKFFFEAVQQLRTE